MLGGFSFRVEEGTPAEIRRTRNPVVRGFIEGKPELMDRTGRDVSPLIIASGERRQAGRCVIDFDTECSMDALTMAEELFGDLHLDSEQVAQLRAINYQYWLDVHELLHHPGRPGGPEGELTEAETAELETRVKGDLLEILTPEQRRAVDARRHVPGMRPRDPGR